MANGKWTLLDSRANWLNRFKDKAALEAHRSSDASAALKKGAAAEGSLLAAPEIDVVELLGGFPQRG